MENPLARMQRRLLEVIQQETGLCVEAVLKDAFQPEKFLRFIRLMGIDLSQLPGMVGQQPGIDPYQVLGVDRSASDEEIKKRYRELLHKLHPDTAGVEGTGFLVRMVLAAYELIKRERGWQ